jgi:hypothetical protein
MTLAGSWLGHEPTGRTATLPCFCVFEMDGATIRSERFFFDLAAQCDQLGIPIGDARAQLAAVETAAAVSA